MERLRPKLFLIESVALDDDTGSTDTEEHLNVLDSGSTEDLVFNPVLSSSRYTEKARLVRG